MTASPLTADGKHEKYNEIFCSVELTSGIHNQLIFLSVLNTVLSVTAFLGNTLILLALRKVTSLHPPSKLLYRNLAATDFCVGVIVEPLNITYLIAVLTGRWNICRRAFLANFISAYILGAMTLSTMAAISFGQASSAVVEAQIQTIGNLEEGLSNCNCVMDCVGCLCGNTLLEFPSNNMVRLFPYITVFSLIDCIFCENFSCSRSSTNSRAASNSPRTV